MLDLSMFTVAPVGEDWQREFPGYYYAQIKGRWARLGEGESPFLLRTTPEVAFRDLWAELGGEPCYTKETVTLTPTWAGLLPVLLALLENGDTEGRATARAELARMAQAADLWNARCVEENL